MAPTTLKDLFIDELKDLYDAENQILQALPKMAAKASADDLKTAFQDHERQTQEHVQRLQEVFQKLGESPTGKKCVGIQGIVREGEQLMQQGGDPETLDAGMIATAQKVEHYEMAGYGTVRTWAKRLGMNDCADLLQKTLDEEGETDKKLTALAESHINKDAMHGQKIAA